MTYKGLDFTALEMAADRRRVLLLAILLPLLSCRRMG